MRDRLEVWAVDPVTRKWVREDWSEPPMLSMENLLAGLGTVAFVSVCMLALIAWSIVAG